MGAGLTVSEMMSSNPQVWESDKSRLRMVHIDEPGIRTVQIAGSDSKEMADAARINVESGAQIIDINMGCPAKVNRKLAGSALCSTRMSLNRSLPRSSMQWTFLLP